MAISAGTVVADAKMNLRGFMRDLKVMRQSGSKAADRVAKKWRDVGSQFQRVGGMLTAGLTLPLIGAGGLALKTAADYESLRQSMDILNKSTEEGARNFRQLKEFSARTPFQLKDLAKAQNMLQGFGMSADDAFESMSMIGDIAAVASGDIQGIGIAFGQAAAEGRLMTRDIRQLINQGVPAIKILASTMGVAESQIFDMASQGKISFEILQEAFRDATSEGGQFADGMAKQAKTLGGTFSTMRDSISLALGDVGAILGEIAKPFMRLVIDMADSFRELNRTTKIVITSVGGLAGAIGPLSFAIGGVLKMLPLLTRGFKKLHATLLTNPWYAVGAAIAYVGTQAVMAHKDLNMLHKETKRIIDQASDLDAVNKQIAELGKEYKKAAENAKTVPGMETEDFVDPKTAAQLQRLIKLKERLSAQAFVSDESKRELADVSKLMQFVNTDFEELFGVIRENKGTVAKPVVEAKKAIDKILPALDQMQQGFKELSADQIMQGVPVNVGEKIFPPGSIGAMQEKLQGLREKLRMATNPETISQLKNQIGLTREQMNALMGATSQAASAGRQLGQSLGQALSQAVLHGKNFLDVAKNLVKQLSSQVFVQGLTAIITGGSSLAAGSIGSAIFGGLFHSGGIIPGTGERMIRAKGGEMVLTPSQQKALGSMMGGGRNKNIRVKLDIGGEFKQHGSEMRATINESQYIDAS